ncbi:MAG TPA: hypothetical protein DDW27_06405 [Bacteroidales bacterium]|nr:hypothetical protein [Bacteroidales bacterium]
MPNKLIFIIVFTLSFTSLKGLNFDTSCYTDTVFDKRIRTLQLYREEWNLSYPIIRLNSTDKLALHFDLIDNHPETYYYTFIHCNKDWEKSDIFINDYLEGFTFDEITDYKSSFNTTVAYFHYKLIFPGDRLKPLLSGNYIIYVYNYDNPEKPVITRRFMITEDAAKVEMRVRRPQMNPGSNENQQIAFTVNTAGLDITDPYRNIYSFILQNGRWNNAKKNLKPDIYGNNELRYNTLSDKNIFRGGNEYRYFDIKSIRRSTENIDRIDFRSPNYHALLRPSDNREFKPYFYWQDFNGKYYIAVQEGRDPDTDADYIYVYFTLPSQYEVDEGRMYVSGALADWSFGQENIMLYNPSGKQYECTMFLKQGWYNYEYVNIRKGDRGGEASRFEGSHYQTENDYHVLVYYRNPRERYDRLLTTGTTNTLNRMVF